MRMATPDPDLRVYVNGTLIPAREATVPVWDSGLNFADGVFEGVRVYARRVFKLHEHVARLYRSARAFQIDVGMAEAQFADAVLGWLAANRVRDDFHFRPIVTRGNRYPPRMDPRFVEGGATILFVGGSMASAGLEGMRVIVSSLRRTGADVLDPRIKSLNYGNNLLARLEARRRGVDDAIMLDREGFVAEASGANVFVVRDGQLLTPWPKACLEGITRRTLMELATAEGVPASERDITATEVVKADEVFLAGTGTEVAPVTEVEGIIIGSGQIGPVTRMLASRYAELVRSTGAPIHD
jgi:branched-chain amino acid aminotransferase